ADIAGHARLRAIVAQGERFVVAGEVRSEGLCLEVAGERVSRLPCEGAPITALAPVGDALVAARGAELVRLGPEGALPLGARLAGPADAETPLELGPLLALSHDELLVAADSMGVFRVAGARVAVDHRFEREPSTAGGTEPVAQRISSLAMHDGI